MDTEKNPSQSKKFIAFFASIVVLASILTIALFTQAFSWQIATFMCIGILAIGGLAIGYVLSQSSLDKWMRGLKGIINVKSDDSDKPLE